jgi:hypothetical protein
MEVLISARSRACLVSALVAAASLSRMATADEGAKTRRGLASDSVREALQCEVYALTAERSRLLAEAVEQDPKLDAAQWQLGRVKDDHGKWIDHDQAAAAPGVTEKLAEYERVRAKYPDTVDGQLSIANWCAKRKLVQQERAHLMRILDLAPDHVDVRAKLGFVRSGSVWLSREAIAAEQEQQLQNERDLKTWRPVVQEIIKDLRHRSEDRQKAATERLMAIHDPAALPAMLEVVFGANEKESLLFVEAQAQMAAPDAAIALARAALFAPSPATRQAAVTKLSEREFEEYVPQLLATLYSPVTSKTATALLPNGQIGLRQVFVREGVDRQEVLQVDTRYERVARFGGNQADSINSAVIDAVNIVSKREQAAMQQNAITEALNQRVIAVLSETTKQQFPDVAGWWKWWNDRTEIVQVSKAVVLKTQTQAVKVVDYVPPPPTPRGSSGTGGGSTGSGGRSGSGGRVEASGNQRGGTATALIVHECLAAGTTVWTLRGATTIESVRVGDLMLSRDQDSGELAYKPVLRTTVRPKGPIVRLNINGDTIETSGGHLFWVSGEGWTRSRELQPGMVLHGASGPARVTSTEAGEPVETYNLVVADFSTYFVGSAKVLSHDFLTPQPTRAIVPGLRLE